MCLSLITPATETPTRESHDFEHANNDVFKCSYFPRPVREWNSLPSDVVASESLQICLN